MNIQYVVIKKARGSKGIYREVQTEPMSFENAQSECTGMNIQEMTDAVIEFYVTVDQGKKIGEKL